MINRIQDTNLDNYPWWNRAVVEVQPKRMQPKEVVPTRVAPFLPCTRKRRLTIPPKTSVLPFLLIGVTLWIFLKR